MHREPHPLTEMQERGEKRSGGRTQHQQTEGTCDGLWSKLPFEVLERVLLFLPVPDLCRYRSVCKMWNSLICTPEFGTLCVHNASNGVSKGECFVVKLHRLAEPRRTYPRVAGTVSLGIFDLRTKRWYNMKDEIPKGFVHYDVLAMDGGLVCTFVNTFTDEQRGASTIENVETTEPYVLVVFNLIERRMKVLPNPPLLPPRFRIPYTNLTLVVDDISKTYKLFLIVVGCEWGSRDYREHRLMCVYESSTNQWRISANPPVPPIRPGHFGPHVCSAVFQGVLYVLFSRPDGAIYRLYSYNCAADAWEDSGVGFGDDHLRITDLCDLVVSDNRLFLMSQRLVEQNLLYRRPYPYRKREKRETNRTQWPLDISEILLADQVCRTVVQMTEADLRQSFDVPNENNSFKIRAYGFDKSILLTSNKVHGNTGKYILYNLVTGLWEFLPPNPEEGLRFRRGYKESLWKHGERMSYLRLPSTPWG